MGQKGKYECREIIAEDSALKLVRIGSTATSFFDLFAKLSAFFSSQKLLVIDTFFQNETSLVDCA